MPDEQPLLYTELADWWPLLSPPSDYGEEAADLLRRIATATEGRAETLLELGCGGGSLAHHLKGTLQLTLTDRSEGMLNVSRRINPECTHVMGDMRSLRLDEPFDVVLVHDAIMYAADRDSVEATLQTARSHCRAGGACFLLPDCVKETFAPSTDHGGRDGEDGRALRYLEWTWDPDPTDDTYEVAYGFLLRQGGMLRSVTERHTLGLFSRAQWWTWIEASGFEARHSVNRWNQHVFEGRRSASS